MYAHTSGKVRAYGQFSRNFNTTNGVRQDCPISLFLFEFVIDNILHGTMDKRIISGINILETGNFFDLEYADDIVCSFDSFEEAQATLIDLNVAAGRYGLSFAPSKCKFMLTDWTGSITPLTLSDDELDFVDSFTYLGICINTSGNITDEITFRISRARAVFGNLHDLWRRTDMCLLTKDRVYNRILSSNTHLWLQNMAKTCRGPSSTAGFRSQMSKDHWTYLLEAEDKQRGGASEGFSDQLTKPKAWVISSNRLVFDGSVMSSEWTRSV